MRVPALTLALLSCVLSGCRPQADTPPPTVAPAAPSAAELLAQGEYLVRIGGCNDCHTPGYMDKAGDVPKELWLTGNQLGFKGPWGTTYPANLRIRVADMDEAAWLKYSAELHTRPVMPDFTVRAMKEQDRLAMYRFIKSLGSGGQPAPPYLPPGQEPAPPYMELVLPPAPATPAQPPPG
jgi:mono/diheme cytochrome c family protein